MDEDSEDETDEMEQQGKSENDSKEPLSEMDFDTNSQNLISLPTKLDILNR